MNSSCNGRRVPLDGIEIAKSNEIVKEVIRRDWQ
jgi:hypothetical protein